MAMPRYLSFPSTGTVHEQAAAVNGESACGVSPARVLMESSDRDPFTLLQVILEFTVTELAVLSMDGGGVLLSFFCTPADCAQSAQPGSIVRGNVAPYIPTEFSVVAEAAETALVLSSSSRVCCKGPFTVVPPLAGDG